MLEFLNYFGTAVFAISGAFAAARKGMDIAGVILLAFVVGNGGGTMRDVFLGHGAVFWVHQTSFAWGSMLAGAIAIFLVRFFVPPYKLLLVADALGLGVFVTVGAQIALNDGTSNFIAILMGILTATGGSITRDLICNEVPLILRHEIYVTVALIGAVLFIACKQILPDEWAYIITITTTFSIRMMAIYFDWEIPAFSHAWFVESKRKDEDNQ